MNNTDMPLVSVIMGVYNTEIKYLKKAVESILTQTYDCLEFVIVDDGNTKDEIKSYLNKIRQDDKRVKLIINDNNIAYIVIPNADLIFGDKRFEKMYPENIPII